MHPFLSGNKCKRKNANQCGQLMKIPLFLAIVSVLFAGCVSNSQQTEFVKTITFSSLQTFHYKHTLVTGMDFRESEEQMLEELSPETLIPELTARGFNEVDSGGDFFVVTKWKKSVVVKNGKKH